MTESSPWYADGLRFTCTQCGKCCTGAPGFTWVSEVEADALSVRFGMDGEAFRARYTRLVWRQGEQRRTLLEKRGGDCVFYKRGVGCTVYEQRPKQCGTWPFWGRIVFSREDWNDSAQECPGMNRGELHGAEKITAVAADDGLS